MANITSSRKRPLRRGQRSFKPDPVKLRPLRYKTALGLAFEGLAERMGLPPAEAPMKLTATWEGSR